MTVEPLTTDEFGASFLSKWLLLTANTDGVGITIPGAADRTVQALGTFGSATVAIEGSMDNSIWFPLTDPTGTAITFTVAGGKVIMENPLWIRARLSTGGSGAVITVYILSRSTMR